MRYLKSFNNLFLNEDFPSGFSTSSYTKLNKVEQEKFLYGEDGWNPEHSNKRETIVLSNMDKNFINKCHQKLGIIYNVHNDSISYHIIYGNTPTNIMHMDIRKYKGDIFGIDIQYMVNDAGKFEYYVCNELEGIYDLLKDFKNERFLRINEDLMDKFTTSPFIQINREERNKFLYNDKLEKDRAPIAFSNLDKKFIAKYHEKLGIPHDINDFPKSYHAHYGKPPGRNFAHLPPPNILHMVINKYKGDIFEIILLFKSKEGEKHEYYICNEIEGIYDLLKYFKNEKFVKVFKESLDNKSLDLFNFGGLYKAISFDDVKTYLSKNLGVKITKTDLKLIKIAHEKLNIPVIIKGTNEICQLTYNQYDFNINIEKFDNSWFIVEMEYSKKYAGKYSLGLAFIMLLCNDIEGIVALLKDIKEENFSKITSTY